MADIRKPGEEICGVMLPERDITRNKSWVRYNIFH
jgi:hypothetical protein